MKAVKKQRCLLIVALLISLMAIEKVEATTQVNLINPIDNESFTTRIVNYVHKIVSNFNYSKYRMGGTHWDDAKGVYILDCSRYIDYLLEAMHPEAYSSLVSSSGSDQPNSRHYYDFFSNLSNDGQEYWNKIEHVEQLQAGDILVFQYKNSRKRTTGGHVMVVMDKPIRDSDAFLVRVADSARGAHSEDTREPHDSGIGIGTLLLQANPKTGRPSAFAWTFHSYWQHNVNFAMARPVDVGLEKKFG